MPDPTLKDVLDAIARLEKAQSRLEKGQASLEKNQASLDAKIAKGHASLDANIEEHRAETRDGFEALSKQIAELEADLDRHMSAHAKIEKRLDALEKARAPRPAVRPVRGPERAECLHLSRVQLGAVRLDDDAMRRDGTASSSRGGAARQRSAG